MCLGKAFHKTGAVIYKMSFDDSSDRSSYRSATMREKPLNTGVHFHEDTYRHTGRPKNYAP